jgi:ABC-type phosphonate transport system ATPase subunit
LNLRAARIQELEAQLAGKSETHCWVPREPTEEMVFACRGALQQHVASLSEAERRELPRAPWGYVFTPREKMLLRWRAMLAAAGEK